MSQVMTLPGPRRADEGGVAPGQVSSTKLQTYTDNIHLNGNTALCCFFFGENFEMRISKNLNKQESLFTHIQC